MSEPQESVTFKGLHWVWLLVSAGLGIAGGVGGSQVVRNVEGVDGTCDTASLVVRDADFQQQIDRRFTDHEKVIAIDAAIAREHGAQISVNTVRIDQLRHDVDRLETEVARHEHEDDVRMRK